MRCTRFILALLIAGALLGIGGTPAARAHFCAIPAKVDVRKDVIVHVGVAAEAKAVRAVDVRIPSGFDLIEPIGYSGWASTVRGRWVHFEGGEIRRYSCSYFALSGRASRRGRLVARVVTTADDGTKTRFDDLRLNSELAAQVIYAGVLPEDFAEERSSGPGLWVGFAVAVTAGALVAGGAYAFNRRR